MPHQAVCAVSSQVPYRKLLGWNALSHLEEYMSRPSYDDTRTLHDPSGAYLPATCRQLGGITAPVFYLFRRWHVCARQQAGMEWQIAGPERCNATKCGQATGWQGMGISRRGLLS